MRALIITAIAASAAAPSWTTPHIMSDTDISPGPELAMSSTGAALAVWERELGPDCAQSPASLTCAHFVAVLTRDPETSNWNYGIDLIARPGIGARPRVALNEAGRAAVIWVHDIGRDRVVQATYRTGPSERFPNPNDLSGAVLEVRSHHVGLDGAGNAVVVWAERHDQDFAVAGEMRNAASGTWGAPLTLSAGAVRAGPSLAVTPAGEAFAAWIEGTAVKLARADLAKGVWDPPLTLSRDGGVGASVAVNPNGDVVAAWALASHPGVEAAVRPVGGAWGAPVMLADDAQTSAGPDVAFAANGTAVVVWAGAGTLRSSVRSPDGTWSRPTALGPADLAEPDVAVDPEGNAVAVWIQRSRLLTATRPAAAGAWQPPEELSGAEVSGPRVALDARGRGIAVWNLRTGDSLPVLTADLVASWKPTLESTKRPAIQGPARVGRVVTCSRGTWVGTVPISYTYRWLRDGRVAPSGSHYRVRLADVGARLTCRVTARNAAGTLAATSRPVRIRR